MNIISIDDIIVPDNRQRREFDESKLDELVDSIESRGLLHPIVLRNDGRTLVAGERRLRAIQKLHNTGRQFNFMGTGVNDRGIPFSTIGELDDLSLREAELEENVIRQDLSWQEKAKATAELHRLRQERHGTYDGSTKEGWTATNTATEIQGRPAKKHEIQEVTAALHLEEFLHDPIVAAARNPKEALKIIKEEKKRIERQKRAREFDASSSPHTLIRGNCYNVLHDSAFESQFDVLLTDPPYGIDINKIKFWDGTKHEYDDSDETFTEVCTKLPALASHLTKPEAHAYVFCDIRRFNDLFVVFELAGWDVWPTPIIWHKGNTGSFPNADYGPRRTYEAILYANRGRKPITAMYVDVIIKQQPAQTDHPAEKPIEVLTDLLRRSVLPGDKIVDPFAGSGNIFPAASQMQCTATAVELNDDYYNIAVSRLEETK